MRHIKEVIMCKWFPRLRQTTRGSRPIRPRTFRPTLESLEERSLLDAGMIGFIETNLVSDLKGVAAHTDASLVNPWGFAETPGGQFQVAANGTGDTLHLNARGATIGPAVVLQPPLGSPPGTTTSPNGTVLNATPDFVISDDGKSAPAEFIFSTEDGTIVAFNPQVDPKEGILAAQSTDGAVYKLLAEASNAKGNFLFATDFHNNKIDVFDKNFDKVTLGQNGWGTFTDPNEPAGYAPFGIKLINVDGQDRLFVTYAKQDAAGHDDVAGPGNGFIDEYTTTGQFIQRFATGSAVGGTAPLNSPIGMAIAPAGFGPNGKFGGALLVGNFGDSHVSAFDLKTGQFLGQLSDAQGNPLTLNGGVGGSGTKGLWGIAFGNGHGGTDPNTLYFAAGINDENDGLFGKVTMTDGGNGHNSDMMSNSGDNNAQQQGIVNLFANNSATAMSNSMQPGIPMNGMPMPSASAGQSQSGIDAFFQTLDARLMSLESDIVARMPQLAGMIQSFNAMGTQLESTIAGHPINDLSDKV
jgi:uncharacterized protein (TIGR03118 family)